MPIIEVKILEGRSFEQKKRMVKGIVDVLVNTIDANPEAIKIHIVDMKNDSYAIAGKFISENK